MKKIFFILFLVSTKIIFAQSYDTIQRKSILLTNATIHIGNGTVYENGVIGFDKGKIILIGDATTIKYDQTKFSEIINCTGKHIYPGLIALNTQLGLKEIELVRASNDISELGEMNPNVRSVISYNTDSKVIPTIRTNGILTAQIVPQGGVISGTSSVVQLDAWNWEDAALKTDEGMHVNWPAYYAYSFDGGVFQITVNKNYTESVNKLKIFFDEANAYCKINSAVNKNLKFEAMRNLFNGKTKLFIHANSAKEIISAIQFAAQYNLTPIIVGASEAYKVLDILKEKYISVILEDIHTLPSSTDADIKMPYKLPSILQNAGIEYAISLSFSHWNMRNLPFTAGTAVANG
ncbi:MAG: amidohydrolase, partial [Fimbriimonadaceae bacterium]|nr:amidohydrolase [Chitinophagales bacterium]